MSRLIEDRMKGCKIGELAITKKFDRQGKAKRKTKRKTKKR
jgi:ribosomal protein S19